MKKETGKYNSDGFIRKAAKAAALCALAALMACAAPAASQASQIQEGDGAAVTGDGMVAIGDNAKADGTYAVAIGEESEATGFGSTAVGAGGALAKSEGSIAIGNSSYANGRNSISIGNSSAQEDSSIAIGNGAQTGADYAVAVGYEAKASGEHGTALGRFAAANGDDSVAIGNAANVFEDYDDGVAIGNGTKVEANNAAALGAYSIATEENTVSVGGGRDPETREKIYRRITNLADGTADTDAATVGQLGAVKELVDDHEDQFTSLQEILGNTYDTPTFNKITVGNITSDGVDIDMRGGTITGLTDGGVYQGSTDAVTGNQLWEAYRRMGDMQEAINVVGAHAAALSGLHPIQYNPYEPTTLSAAVGTYRDEYAVAVGVFHYIRSNVLFNLGASICSDGDVMGRAGVSFAVGKGGKKKPELARDMVGMQQQMLAMQAMLEELKEENAKNKETIRELKEALEKKK